MNLTKEQKAKVKKVMAEFKAGKLHHGSKEGKVVTDKKIALAIAFSEAGVEKQDDDTLSDHLEKCDQIYSIIENKENLEKSFSNLEINKIQNLMEQKTKLEKSFDILNDPIEKALDTSKLVKRQVQIHGADGKTYTGYRWVSPLSGQPESTGKETKETTEFKKKEAKKPVSEKEDETSSSDTEFANKILEVSSSGGSKSKRIRDLVGLGVYDISFIMQMNDDVNVSNVTAYLKEAGVDYKKCQENLTTNINVALGNTDEIKDKAVSELQKTLKQKELSKVLKDKKQERAKSLGITASDKFDTYKFMLDQIIGDRMARSLVVYGTGGIGKTYNLEKKLEEYGKIGFDPELDLDPSEYDYLTITGNTTPSDLYQKMYENPKKLIIFDDCDAMWDNEISANLLKGALDTSGNGLISYPNPKKLPDGTTPPKSFKFSGQIIFISNLPREKFYQPIIDSRSNALDMSMSMDQTLELLDSIKYQFVFKDADKNEVDVPKEYRDQIMKVLNEFKPDLRVEQVNGRVLLNLAGLKISLSRKGKTSYDDFKKQAMIALDLV